VRVVTELEVRLGARGWNKDWSLSSWSGCRAGSSKDLSRV
jgi:hypothetical protein